MGVMPTVAERVSVVEVQVSNLDERFDELKEDVHGMGTSINSRLDQMYHASCQQHAELATSLKSSHKELDSKIVELQQFKNKGVMYLMLALAFLAGTGWLGHVDLKAIVRFVGL